MISADVEYLNQHEKWEVDDQSQRYGWMLRPESHMTKKIKPRYARAQTIRYPGGIHIHHEIIPVSWFNCRCPIAVRDGEMEWLKCKIDLGSFTGGSHPRSTILHDPPADCGLL